MRRLAVKVSIALFPGFGLTLALLWLLGCLSTGLLVVRAAGFTVCPAGPPTCDYSTIQDAVDAAGDGDTIQVATGVYTDVQRRAAPVGYLGPPASGIITQVVYISKTVTIRGGYTPSFADPADPEANPTTLDAQGQGRVIFITGDISPTIESLRITGGDADGLGGDQWWSEFADAGGGVYVISATPTISNNYVFSNTVGSYGDGGGLYLAGSAATLIGNIVTTNATNHYGGGLFLYQSSANLISNTVTANTARQYGNGGGLFLEQSPANLSGNTIYANTAFIAGGLALLDGNDVTLSENVIISNSADVAGGLAVGYSNVALSRNIVTSNTARVDGGGLILALSQAVLINNVVADNQAPYDGGLLIRASSAQLLHNTIARNMDSGVYVTEDMDNNCSNVAMTNTILVNQTVGITVAAGSTATLESTLWYSNTADWGGAGTIVTGTHNYRGDPRFASDGYHLECGSAAIDRGVNAGVAIDIDGEPRPSDRGYDLGADESLLPCKYLHFPIILKNY
jgi:hypothetical protein